MAKKILVGGWFDLPRLGRDVFAVLMKQGVVYDKSMGFKLDSATDIQAAVRTLRAATGEEVELSLRCFVCVPGGTVIIGDNKEIRASRPMELSAGVSGLSRIKKRFSRKYDGDLIRIKANGLLPIDITPEHPVLVSSSTTLRRVGGRKHQTTAMSGLHWKEAGRITRKTEGVDGDYLFIPRLNGNITYTSLSLSDFTNENGTRVCVAKHLPLDFPLNPDTAWLLGVYVAEGFPSGTCANFSLDHNESEIQQRIIDVAKSLGYSAKKYRRATSTVVVIPSRLLLRALAAWCGKGAHRKHIPDFLLFHTNLSLLRSFLDGYIAGDGFISDEASFMGTTSRLLALQIQLLAARLGEFVSITRTESGSSMIGGREVRGNPEGKYVMAMRPRSPRSFAKVTGLGILTPIRKIDRIPFKGRVYNLETGDNTYLVSNVIVHNCGKEACTGCPFLESCDRASVSSLCLCSDHAPEKSVYGSYTKTFDVALRA